jgi:hypothetical protein
VYLLFVPVWFAHSLADKILVYGCLSTVALWYAIEFFGNMFGSKSNEIFVGDKAVFLYWVSGRSWHHC